MKSRAFALLLPLALGCDLLRDLSTDHAPSRAPTSRPAPQASGGWVAPQSDTNAGAQARARVSGCAPDTDEESQNRTNMKHRPLPHSLAGATPTSVSQMLTWPPPDVVGQRGVRNQDSPLDMRETMIFMATVDVVLAKLSEGDCDLHLEVVEAGAGPGADRVILEVPQGDGYDAMRLALADALGRRGRGFGRGELSPPLRVQVAGYGFYDVHHACSRDRQRGCTHGSARVGTLWELHPVVGLSFVGQ